MINPQLSKFNNAAIWEEDLRTKRFEGQRRPWRHTDPSCVWRCRWGRFGSQAEQKRPERPERRARRVQVEETRGREPP